MGFLNFLSGVECVPQNAANFFTFKWDQLDGSCEKEKAMKMMIIMISLGVVVGLGCLCCCCLIVLHNLKMCKEVCCCCEIGDPPPSLQPTNVIINLFVEDEEELEKPKKK